MWRDRPLVNLPAIDRSQVLTSLLLIRLLMSTFNLYFTYWGPLHSVGNLNDNMISDDGGFINVTFWEGPSTVFWVAVVACTVVIRPSKIPEISVIIEPLDHLEGFIKDSSTNEMIYCVHHGSLVEELKKTTKQNTRRTEHSPNRTLTEQNTHQSDRWWL